MVSVLNIFGIGFSDGNPIYSEGRSLSIRQWGQQVLGLVV
jgi:hypothetical protein